VKDARTAGTRTATECPIQIRKAVRVTDGQDCGHKTTLCDVPGSPCERGPITPGVLRQRVPVNGEAFRTKFLYLEGHSMLHDTHERSEVSICGVALASWTLQSAYTALTCGPETKRKWTAAVDWDSVRVREGNAVHCAENGGP